MLCRRHCLSRRGCRHGSKYQGPLIQGGEQRVQLLLRLGSLRSLGGELYVVYNNALVDFDGFGPVSTISGNIYIRQNPAMESLQGLGSLLSAGGAFKIWENDSLADIQALGSLRSVWGSFQIYDNRSLCGSHVEDLSDKIGESITSSGNNEC